MQLDNPDLFTDVKKYFLLFEDIINMPEKIALEFTESVMKNSLEITDSFFENLRSLFSQEEIVELTFLIGYINMLNYFNNTLQVSYQGDYDS